MYRDFGSKADIRHTDTVQCYESGSGLDPESNRLVDPDPDPGGQKRVENLKTHKSRKKLETSCFEVLDVLF